MIIRKETPADYARIADLHAQAFSHGPGQDESVLVALLRQEATFDPQLSIVAEADGDIIGHVIVTPYTFYLNNEEVRAGILAPLGVSPAWQKKGVGSKLMKAVHQTAVDLGLAFILLLGHDTYYPRFGYQTNMFGETNVEVSLPKETGENCWKLTVRKPVNSDISPLEKLWFKTHEDVPLCLKPENNLLSWISTSKEVSSLVFVSKEDVVGYIRIHKRDKNIYSILAKDRVAASQVLLHLSEMTKLPNRISLPLHPLRKEWFTGFSATEMTTTVNGWSAGMICPLGSSSSIDSYIKDAVSDKNNMGIIQWPVPFEAI